MGLKTTLAERLIRSWIGDAVKAGPFAGMRYLPRQRSDAHASMGNSFAHKLLGTYELELRRAVEGLIAAAPAHVVNVGAGEGYYAVGLARALPGARVTAFEADTAGRDMLARTAALNDVASRLEIKGPCIPEELEAAIGQGPPGWLVMDVEGAEDQLLDPEQIPTLRRWSVLVEVHERIVPGLSATLNERFRGTHEVEIIRTRERTLADFPMVPSGWRRAIPGSLLLKAMDEKRGGPMEWFVLHSRVDASS